MFVVGAATALLAVSAQGAVVRLYVSPTGNDAWSGSIAESNAEATDGPLASIAAARDKVRQLRSQGAIAEPVEVALRGGRYEIAEPIAFTPEDSGTYASPVAYRAYPGEHPVVSGGRRIASWRKEDRYWVADVSGFPAFNALWVNGRYRHMAKSPNADFFYTAGKAPEKTDPATNQPMDRAKNAFHYAEGDMKKWDDMDRALLVMLHAWDVSYHPIANLEEDAHVVNLVGNSSWPFEHWGPKQRYFVQGVFEALDEPGEWYLNAKTNTLYYIPFPDEDMTMAEVIAPVADQLLVFEGKAADGKYVEFITVSGLEFNHAQFAIPATGMPDYQAAFPVVGAVHARGARHCAIIDNTIGHVGTYAIWFGSGCQDNRIVRNHCYDLGAGGVRIGEGGDPATEGDAVLRNVVDNNWLHDGGKIFPAAVGVWIGRASYNTVTHNEISDFFYTGVSVGWSWGYAPSSANHNIIEYNHIHHIGKGLLSDMGGIYTLGVAPGTTLRYNLIHDVWAYSYGGWGIYPDEGSSDLLIENNVVYKTKTGTFHQHYGKENRVRNNIFAFSANEQIIRTREEEHRSFSYEQNIVYFDEGELLGSNWSNGKFLIDGNCYWDARGAGITFKGKSFDEWRAAGNDVRSIIADPLFVDAASFDFRLRPESPALALGFQPIDTSRIGLYGDAAWIDGPKGVERE